MSGTNRAAQQVMEAQAAIRRPKVFDLRVAGASFRQIAEKLGIALATAHKDYQVFLADHTPPVEEIAAQRELEVARADDGIMRCNLALETVKDENTKSRILDTRLRYQQHRARLLGLYAPVELRVEATVGIEVDGSLEISAEDWARDVRLMALQDDVRKLLPAGVIETTLVPTNGNGNGNGGHP